MYKSLTSILLIAICIISCDKAVSVSPNEIVISTGVMFIDSYPQGSQIYLNGRIAGRITPDSIKWLEEGNYEVLLRKPLYRDTSVFVNVQEEGINNIFIDYTNNPGMRGSIDCITNPENASVYLNDSLIDQTTPCTISNLWPGLYNIRYGTEGHRDAMVDVVVRSSELSNAAVTLVDTAIWNDFTTSNSAIISDYLTSVAVAADNSIWVGTKENGIAVYNRGTWSTFNVSNSVLPTDSVTCLKADVNGDVWIGTRSGFTKYENGNFYNYGMGIIEDIEIDNDGTKWIASYGGLIRLTGTSLTLFNSTNFEFLDDRITEIVIDQSGNKWLGNYNHGIIKFNNNTILAAYSRTSSGLPGDRIISGAEDLNGQLWFGHAPWSQEAGGLSTFNNGTWQTIYGLPSQTVEWIYIDDLNNKWIGTGNGLVKLDQNYSITIYNYANTGLNIRHIRCIAGDSNGIMWIATNGGGLITLRIADLQ